VVRSLDTQFDVSETPAPEFIQSLFSPNEQKEKIWSEMSDGVHKSKVWDCLQIRRAHGSLLIELQGAIGDDQTSMSLQLQHEGISTFTATVTTPTTAK
jgi:hypothetical protein